MKQAIWRPSIRLLVAMIVVAPIVVVSLILASLSWEANSRISGNLGQEVMSGAATTVAAEVREYLGNAVRVSDRYTRRVESGVLPDPPRQAWERPMLDDLATSPTVASICYGNLAGDTTWLLRGPGRLEVGRVQGALAGHAIEFAMDPATGRTSPQPLRVYIYDPRQRPWWKVALSSDSPRWTPVYAWFAGNSADTTIGTGYTRQIPGPDGKLRGVLVIDVTLGALNHFLGRMDIAQQGRIYIVDSENRLIAASHGSVVDAAGQSIKLKIPEANTTIDGAPARAEITSLSPYPGIDWRVVAVLPESSFLAEAQTVRRQTIAAGAAAVFASLLLGLALARHLSQPILGITRHVKRVGQGDFDTQLNLNEAKELAVLSQEINRMTGGLRQRMALEQSLAVAMEVQQSLLPAANPKGRGLDIAGRSKYCDETGGDYYDFIDVAPLTDSTLLVAVGDVMGHGIAAALVMATVRGALRYGVLHRPSLGCLMVRANQVLAADNRHNRFMTLALLEIDGQSGVVHWASAGHDPAIVYEPRTDKFQELEGGDVPLGLVEGVEYADYHSQPFSPGTILVIGTDGVWEMLNEQQQQYGKDRLRQAIRTHSPSSANDIAAALEADLAAFRGSQSPNDDVTFVIIKFVEPGKP